MTPYVEVVATALGDPRMIAVQLKQSAGAGVDAAFDATGIASVRRSFSLLRPSGVLVTYGTRTGNGSAGSCAKALSPQDLNASVWKMLQTRVRVLKLERFKDSWSSVFHEVVHGDFTTLLSVL
jgi:NADPH:quinone reductase-like Zn-dependent oxidoreductase